MEQVLPSGKTVTVIHFIYPLTMDEPKQWRIACMPNMTEFHQTSYHPAYHRSDSPQAVTCFACRKTEMYKMALSRTPK